MHLKYSNTLRECMLLVLVLLVAFTPSFLEARVETRTETSGSTLYYELPLQSEGNLDELPKYASFASRPTLVQYLETEVFNVTTGRKLSSGDTVFVGDRLLFSYGTRLPSALLLDGRTNETISLASSDSILERPISQNVFGKNSVSYEAGQCRELVNQFCDPNIGTCQCSVREVSQAADGEKPLHVCTQCQFEKQNEIILSDDIVAPVCDFDNELTRSVTQGERTFVTSVPFRIFEGNVVLTGRDGLSCEQVSERVTSCIVTEEITLQPTFSFATSPSSLFYRFANLSLPVSSYDSEAGILNCYGTSKNVSESLLEEPFLFRTPSDFGDAFTSLPARESAYIFEVKERPVALQETLTLDISRDQRENELVQFVASLSESRDELGRILVDWNGDGSIDQHIPPQGYQDPDEPFSFTRMWPVAGTYRFSIAYENELQQRTPFTSSAVRILPGGDTEAAEAIITATPQYIDEGGQVTLRWSSENATECTSGEFDTGGATEGVVSINNVQNFQTYRLTCSNDESIATDMVVVDPILLSPSIAIDYKPKNIDKGESVLLTWNSRAADTCSSSDFETRGLANGTVIIESIQDNLTLEIVCEGKRGIERKQIDIILPELLPPTVTLSAEPVEIFQGDSTIIKWNSGNANVCTSENFSTNNKKNGVTIVSNVTEDTIFTIECSNGNGVTRKSQNVEVITGPTSNTQFFDRLAFLPELLRNVPIPRPPFAEAADLTPPSCAFSPASGRTIVEFNGNRVRADMGDSSARLDKATTYLAPIAPFTYAVSLHAWDGATDRSTISAQPDEEYYVELYWDNNQSGYELHEVQGIAPSGASWMRVQMHVRDGTGTAYFDDLVVREASDSGDLIQPCTSVSGNLAPNCSFENSLGSDYTLYSNATHQSDIAKQGSKSIKIVGNGGLSRAFSNSQVFPVSAGDVHTARIYIRTENMSESAEARLDLSYWTAEDEWISTSAMESVQVPDNRSILAQSDSTEDLADNVTEADLIEVVTPSLSVPSAVNTIVARHNAYSDSNANSLYPICVAFDTETPPTASVNADPTEVDAGGTVTISWTSLNATSCTGTNFSTGGATSGSVDVSNVTEDTTYSLECTGTGGTDNDSVEVTISEPSGDPPVVSITVDPASTASGGSATVSWSSVNTTSCSGTNFTTGGLVSGSDVVSGIISDTVFTLSCTGSGGTAEDSVTIFVSEDAPSISVSASPSTVTSGGSSTLTWNASDATSCTSSQFETGGATSGTYQISGVTQTTTFVLNCIGPGGSSQSSVQVIVEGSDGDDLVPTAYIETIPAGVREVRAGESVTLVWSAGDVTSCTVTGPNLSANYDDASVYDQRVLTINTESTYTISCTSDLGIVEDAVTIEILPTFDEQ